MKRARRHWNLFLTGLLGPRCIVTGDRVYPKDRATHQRNEHGTDGPCQ